MVVFFAVIGVIAFLTGIMAFYVGFQDAEKGAPGGGWFESAGKVQAKQDAYRRSIRSAYRFGFASICVAVLCGFLATLFVG